MYKKHKKQTLYDFTNPTVQSSFNKHPLHLKETDSFITIKKSEYEKLLKTLAFQKEKKQNAIAQKDQYQLEYKLLNDQLESLKRQFDSISLKIYSSFQLSQIQQLKAFSTQQIKQQKTQEGQQILPKQQNLSQQRTVRKQYINKHLTWNQKFNELSLFKSYILKSFKNKQSVQDDIQFETFKFNFVRKLLIQNRANKQEKNSQIIKEQDIDFSQTFKNIQEGFTNILLEKFKDYKGQSLLQDISNHQNFSHIIYIIYKLKKSEQQTKDIIKTKNQYISNVNLNIIERNQYYNNLAKQLQFYKVQFKQCLSGANMIIQAKKRLIQFHKQNQTNYASMQSGKTSLISLQKTPDKPNQHFSFFKVQNSLTSAQIKKNNHQKNQQNQQIRNIISFHSSTKSQRKQFLESDFANKSQEETTSPSNSVKPLQQKHIQQEIHKDNSITSTNQNCSDQAQVSNQLQKLREDNLQTSINRQLSIGQNDAKQQELKEMSQRQNNVNHQKIDSQTLKVHQFESQGDEKEKLENNRQFQKSNNQEQNGEINIQKNAQIQNPIGSIQVKKLENQTNLDIQQIEIIQAKIVENQFQERVSQKKQINCQPQQPNNEQQITKMSIQAYIKVQNPSQTIAINQKFEQKIQNPPDNQSLNMEYQQKANPLSNDIQNQPQQIQNEKELVNEIENTQI